MVGAAIVRDGRLLATRRVRPSPLAGKWEFPGGKVEPGETEAQALRRELLEEMELPISVGRRIGPEVELPGGRHRLQVWTAQTSADPGRLTDHDQLRWVCADEIDDLDWLEPDAPIVAAVREWLLDGTPLTGGAVGGAVLVAVPDGLTVRRPVGPWTPAVHALLSHLRQADLPFVPHVRGIDVQGRESLDFVEGRTLGAGTVTAGELRTPRVLAQIGRWLRQLAESTAAFPATPARAWRRGLAARGDGQVICHNDVRPHNVVVDRDGNLVGVLDWDMAAPGDPLSDLAYTAWQFVLGQGLEVDQQARGVRTMCDAYGADSAHLLSLVGPRLRESLRVIRQGAERGDPGLSRLASSDIPKRVASGLDAFEARLPALLQAL